MAEEPFPPHLRHPDRLLATPARTLRRRARLLGMLSAVTQLCGVGLALVAWLQGRDVLLPLVLLPIGLALALLANDCRRLETIQALLAQLGRKPGT